MLDVITEDSMKVYRVYYRGFASGFLVYAACRSSALKKARKADVFDGPAKRNIRAREMPQYNGRPQRVLDAMNRELGWSV